MKIPHCWKSHVAAQMLVIRAGIEQNAYKNSKQGRVSTACIDLFWQATAVLNF